jgi:hypothetical protein
MNILISRKFVWLISSVFSLSLLVGCGNGVSTDVLRPLWTKQVNQEVTPLMKDVFAPVSSQVSSELVFTSDSSWDVPEEKLPDYKYGLQHAKETENGEVTPLLVIRVKLDQPFESYPLNQLQEQIWSAKEQLKINGVQVGRVKLEYGGKTYFSGSLQAMNNPSDIDQFYSIQSKG